MGRRPKASVGFSIACLLFVCVLPARPASDDFTGFDLLELLADKNKREEGLATIRADQEWVPLLLDAYERDSPQGDSEERTRALREGVLAALRALPKSSFRALGELSADADKDRSDLAFSLIQALGQDAAPMTKELVARASKERNEDTKSAILRTIGTIGVGKAEIRPLFDELFLGLNSPTLSDQVKAARLISQLGPALRPFSKRLEGRLDEDPRVSRPLANAMASSGNPEAVQMGNAYLSAYHSMVGFAHVYAGRLAVHNFDERRITFFEIPSGM